MADWSARRAAGCKITQVARGVGHADTVGQPGSMPEEQLELRLRF